MVQQHPLPPQKQGARVKKVKRTRREETWRSRLEKRWEQIFGGRSIGNIGAALLLVLSIFLGIWVSLQSIL